MNVPSKTLVGNVVDALTYKASTLATDAGERASAMVARKGQAAPEPPFLRLLDVVKGGRDPNIAKTELSNARNSLVESAATLRALRDAGEHFGLAALPEQHLTGIDDVTKGAYEIRNMAWGSADDNVVFAQAIADQSAVAGRLAGDVNRHLRTALLDG